MTLNPLLEEVRGLALPVTDFVVFGSGPLLARNWIQDAGDIDIVSRGAAWERAQQLGDLEYVDEWGVELVNIGPNITVGTRWAIGDVDSDQLIDSAEIIEGLPFAPLDAVVDYKMISRRPKDLAHVRIINERHLNKLNQPAAITGMEDSRFRHGERR